MKSIIQGVLDFLKKVREEKVVFIQFIKKDGTLRTMRCTLDFTLIPPEDRPKSFNLERILAQIQKNRIIHVYDLDKRGWRSIPFDKINWLEANEKRYLIRK